MNEIITRAIPQKSSGLLGGLFGGGDDSAGSMNVLEVGQFKCMLRIYNPEEDMDINQKIIKLLGDVEDCVKNLYQLQMGYNFEFSFSNLDPNDNDLQESMAYLKSELMKAGLN